MSDSQESDPKKQGPEDSDPREGAASGREDRMQEAFDQAAEGLGLELERPSSGHGGDDVKPPFSDAYMLFCFRGHSQVDSEPMPSPPPVGSEDDAAIAEVINGFESLAPVEFAESWQQYATDPYVAVADGRVAKIDHEELRDWLGSDELRAILEEYPLFSPRRVQVGELRIVYLGRVRAVATYHVQEEFTNGRVVAGNGSASLFKLEGGRWRIVIIHERTRDVATP
jgi:hypothetical protein